MEQLPNSSKKNIKLTNPTTELINEDISFDDFYQLVLDRDQSTETREHAHENLKILKSPEVEDYIEKNPDLRGRYYSLLSFTEFHVGQRLITQPAEAMSHLEEAFSYADDISWKSYIGGTILYLKNEIIPEEIICNVTSPENKKVLRCLNKGIQSRGSASYMEDLQTLIEDNN